MALRADEPAAPPRTFARQGCGSCPKGSAAPSWITSCRYSAIPREEEDPANLASLLYQDELDEGLADDLREELAAVERAEARLAAGAYGRSIESGKPIPDERLEALPTAERTAEEEAH